MLIAFFFMLVMSNAICFADDLLSSPPCDCGKAMLEGRIPPNNHRYHTFLSSLNLLCTRHSPVIVETGTARAGSRWCDSDGCSTLIFADWVKNHGGEFYSVDISEANLQNAADALGDARLFAHLVHSDSIPFLSNFSRPIDFLYLDSYDYEYGNPNPSQQHHLKEIVAAYPWLTPTSIVMIDDCALPEGGKGKLVIAYLQERGWKVLVEGYQVILVQE